MSETRYLPKFVRKRMFLVREDENAICVSAEPGLKNCWYGTWLSKWSLADRSFDFINKATGEIEFMVKKSTAKKKKL